MISDGRVDSARAILIRCRWPPENWMREQRLLFRLQAYRLEQLVDRPLLLVAKTGITHWLTNDVRSEGVGFRDE